MAVSPELYSASQIAVRDCMGLQPGERVMVITDEPCRAIGQAIFRVTQDFGNDVFLMEITPRRTHGEEPPAEVAELMQRVDLVLCPTSKSMTHTNAKRAAARCISVSYPMSLSRPTSYPGTRSSTNVVFPRAPT